MAQPLTVIVGQGYVGLSLARGMVASGLSVAGLESREDIVNEVNSGNSHVDDVSNEELDAMLRAGYTCTSDLHVLATASAIVICVPTPLGPGGEPDLSSVEEASRAIATHLQPGTLVVLESTTYPGTTEDLVLPLLQHGGLAIDRDFHLAYSPERVDPGNQEFSLQNTPKIVGGVTAASGDAAEAFYTRFVDRVVRTRGAREAETAKLLENTYRHVNIALMNEMARFCAEMEIDIWDAIRAASSKPFGFQPFYPGPGVGGHCIPIDPNYLSFEVRRRLGHPFRFVELAQEINDSMPAYVVERVRRIANDASKPLRNARILLLGVTYKANVSDERESPAVPIAQLLRREGAIVTFHDPFVAQWRVGGQTLERSDNLAEAVREADIVVLLQAHDVYDADTIARTSSQFFDTRGSTTTDDAVRL